MSLTVAREFKPKITTASHSSPLPLDCIGNTLYGYYDNVLYKSEDEGKTWDIVFTFSTSVKDFKRIVACSDGEVLVQTKKHLYKSVNWQTGSPGWTLKVTPGPGYFVEWSLGGDGKKFITTEYGLPHTESNYFYISLDYGNTWTSILKTSIWPDSPESTHFHGSAYDPIDDTFWISMGDSPYKSAYYSTDGGITWNSSINGSSMYPGSAQSTTISYSKKGMVLGSDSLQNNGVYVIPRSGKVVEMALDLNPVDPGLICFAFKNVRHEDSDITFTCWRSDRDGVYPFISWCNGVTADIFYNADYYSPVRGDKIQNIAVLPNGKIFAWIITGEFGRQVLEFPPFSISYKYQEGLEKLDPSLIASWNKIICYVGKN